MPVFVHLQLRQTRNSCRAWKYRVLPLLMVFLTGMLAVSFSTAAQPGYRITVEVKPYTHSQVYLGYHYGETKALADSALLDGNSKGVFSGEKLLPGGIYFIVSPSKQILFELLVDKDQHFSIHADTTLLPQGVRFTGSPENLQFQQYSAFSGENGRKIHSLQQQYTAVKNSKDSAALTAAIRELSGKIQHYRDSIVQKHGTSFLATLFNAMSEPKIPPASQHPGGKYDSNFVYEYFKEHYWDDVPFDDNRLVRTPFFEPRLKKYFRDLVSPAPDSLIKEIDRMLLYSRTAKDMYQYLMVHFVQEYIQPKYMGQDAVFVHLFEKYINTGQAEFFTPQYKEFATKRAYSLMANLIGKPAAPLQMVDTAGKPLTLHSLPAEFTVLCFWDPGCSHCKEVVPKVDSIFQARWKQLGVQVYAVKVDGSHADWTAFIREHRLHDWKHVYQLPAVREEEEKHNLPGYRQLYDVYQTPLLYLLDKDKRIIAKKLTYLQIDDVIAAKLKEKSR